MDVQMILADVDIKLGQERKKKDFLLFIMVTNGSYLLWLQMGKCITVDKD